MDGALDFGCNDINGLNFHPCYLIVVKDGLYLSRLVLIA